MSGNIIKTSLQFVFNYLKENPEKIKDVVKMLADIYILTAKLAKEKQIQK
ncbi:hypothetical protein [Brochothrix thermosphacta]|nr:hypothetical protein [Brochothrix thermosphacta]